MRLLRIYRVMENSGDGEVNTWYFYNLGQAEAFLWEMLKPSNDEAIKIKLNFDNGTWSLYEIHTEDKPLSLIDQDMRNIVDGITSECSRMMQQINQNPEYFSDDRDRSICNSFLWIKNTLLKYLENQDEKIFGQNSTQENPGDNGSDTGAPKRI